MARSLASLTHATSHVRELHLSFSDGTDNIVQYVFRSSLIRPCQIQTTRYRNSLYQQAHHGRVGSETVEHCFSRSVHGSLGCRLRWRVPQRRILPQNPTP